MACASPLVLAQPVQRKPSGDEHAILVVGDSLSAEYGIARNKGWVALLQGTVDQQRPGYRLVNASISGDTTSGGLSRLAALLQKHQPRVVILELGGNDALRGLALSMTESNLKKMSQMAHAAGARVILAGMQIPPNYGKDYTEAFRNLYPKVAQETGAGLIPFFLKGVAENRDLFQQDGIHPNEDAQPIIAGTVWESLEPILKSIPG